MIINKKKNNSNQENMFIIVQYSHFRSKLTNFEMQSRRLNQFMKNKVYFKTNNVICSGTQKDYTFFT